MLLRVPNHKPLRVLISDRGGTLCYEDELQSVSYLHSACVVTTEIT